MAVSFSIIIPVYNKAKYLGNCIDSIMNQNYRDFEIIAINDGSTDNSLDILQSYKDSRLKLISIPNGGVSNARNIGIAEATKEYITFVDADDTLDYDYLDHFNQEIANAPNCDVIIAGLKKTTTRGESHSVKCNTVSGQIGLIELKRVFISEMFDNEGIFGYVAAKFVRLSVLKKNRILFDSKLKLAEDLDFWARVYLVTDNLLISRYCGYNYLQETENSSMNLSSVQLSQLKIWLNIAKSYSSNPSIERNRVLCKINHVLEAHFLELETVDKDHIAHNVLLTKDITRNIAGELQHNARSFLQKAIAGNHSLLIYLYLNLRKLYHQIRLCRS